MRAAIADLKARGIKVTLYPILLMDMPVGNALGQPAYPWRGRIACSSAAMGTAAAATEIASFADEISQFRPALCRARAAAGGVDAFLIGSELRGLTLCARRVDSFPFVDALVTLAADVRAHAGRHDEADLCGRLERIFGLAGRRRRRRSSISIRSGPRANIDAIGIDNYMPLADWRGDDTGPDAAAAGPHDLDYLKRNIEGGEGFDWYYASDADRLAGTRTPITDRRMASLGCGATRTSPSWWSDAASRPAGRRAQRHADRLGAEIEADLVHRARLRRRSTRAPTSPMCSPTPRAPRTQSPYFSNGAADPLAQRQVLRAVLGYWADPANNPAAPVRRADAGADLSVDLGRAALSGVSDARDRCGAMAAIIATGHWLTGRLGGMARTSWRAQWRRISA